MPYTDRDVVRELVSRTVSSRPATAGSLTDDQIDTSIASAQATIDSRLGVLYTVPFADGSVPALVRKLAADLAAYEADLTFREVRDYSSELNPVYLRYRDALELLGLLGTGKATLPDYVPPDPDPGSADTPGGDVVGVFNPNLCEFIPRRRPDWRDTYYGWTL
jgi:phage gp36-like protein